MHSLNGVDLETDVEVKIQPGRLTLDDAEDTPTRDQVTPERTFKSVNLRIPPATPGVSPTKEMEAKKEEVKEGQEVEMVEAQGEDDEEYEEEEESDELASQDDKYRRPGPEVLSQSPTKRRRR